MSPCARGCCWSPYGCAQSRTCACHWEERKPGGRNNGTAVHADPTATQAIRNVMRTRKER